ncbi:hypothetical protein FS837_006631 [Tulasnella sp. UAMH 9824]|nr:hypothetical protein FS837_006631 [Tulasnella sp. UAMH 9824]
MSTLEEASMNHSISRGPPSLDHDVLTNIFTYCIPSANAVSARVCRKWNKPAMDHLFISLPSLFPLLRVLRPLVIVDGARDFDYDRTPNWKRFWELSARVRTLHHDDDGRPGSTDLATELKGRIAPSVMPYLLLHQSWAGSERFLLPNLENLEWTVHCAQSLPHLPYLTSPNLRELAINLDAASIPSVPVMRCLEVLASLPGLELSRLRITTKYKVKDHDLELAPAVASFVKSQQALSTLEVEWLYSQSEIIQSLLHHQRLVSLELLLAFDEYHLVQTSLQSLAGYCPLIETLKIFCPKNFLQPMTCDIIRPLFRCRQLWELQVCYGGDFRVTSDDVRSMGEAWGELEVLNLCAGAKSSHWDGAPFTLLLDFAAAFGPKLRRLALNFACPDELPTADIVNTSFSQLEILGVGKSKIDSVEQFGALAEFLVSVCPKETEIAYIPKDFWRADAFQTKGWDNVPETKSWVLVKDIMQRMRRFKPAHDRAAGGSQWL